MPEAGLQVHVSSLARLLPAAAALRPTHVLSLIDPELPRIALEDPPRPEQHRTLRFRDVLRRDEPGGWSREQMEALLAFLEEVRQAATTRPVRLLVHCHQGQSRSPAAAYLALALHLGAGQERQAFRSMRKAAPHCWPNLLLVEEADALLARQGALVAPLVAFRKRFRPPGAARFL